MHLWCSLTTLSSQQLQELDLNYYGRHGEDSDCVSAVVGDHSVEVLERRATARLSEARQPSHC